MHNKILEALKAKFPGVSDQILLRLAKKLEPGVKSEDEVTSAVEGVTFQQLLENYGDFRATDATKTAVANYEKKHNIKDGKPVEQKQEHDEEKGAGGEDMPAWAKALIESNKQLTDKVAAIEGGQLTTKRRQQLESVLSNLPEALRKGYERITLDTMEDEAFATLLKEVETEVQGIQQETKEKGAVFGKPKAQGGITGGAGFGGQQKQQASKEEIAEVMKHIPVL